MRALASQVHPESVLVITLDSCRYDSFAAAQAPNLHSVAPLHRAKAPSHFTYGSHAAMFMGFTPSVPGAAAPFIDSKFGKLFQLSDIGFRRAAHPGFQLSGRSIIDGFTRLGYRTIGSGAVRWFDPHTEAGSTLSQDFAAFHYAGCTWALPAQLAFMMQQIGTGDDTPVFAFLNIGETHAPYYYEGAAWSCSDNPCIPYQTMTAVRNARIANGPAWNMSTHGLRRCSAGSGMRRSCCAAITVIAGAKMGCGNMASAMTPPSPCPC